MKALFDKFYAYLRALLVVSFILGASILAAIEIKGYRFYSVASGSMMPVLKIKEFVVVSPLAGWPRVGEIVSYESRITPGEIVSHRVVRVDERNEFIVTKGDNLDLSDPPIRLKQIVGVVRFHSVMLGRLALLLKKPAGLIVGIYGPGLLLILSELRRLFREINLHKNHYSLSLKY